MSLISGNAPISPAPNQGIGQSSPNLPKALQDPALQRLVASAAQAQGELAEVSNRLEQVDILTSKTQELQASLAAATQTGASAATLAAHERELNSIHARLEELGADTSGKLKALREIRDLSTEKNALQGQLDKGGLKWSQRTAIVSRMRKIEFSLECARFDATGNSRGAGGITMYQYILKSNTMEAGTLQSRLNDGGLSPQDKQRMTERIQYLEENIESLPQKIELVAAHIQKLSL